MTRALRGYLLDHKRQVVCILLDDGASVTSDGSTYTVPATVVTKTRGKYRHYPGTAMRRNFREVNLTTKFGTLQCGAFVQEELWSELADKVRDVVDMVEDLVQHRLGGRAVTATVQAPGHEPLTYELRKWYYWHEMGDFDNDAIFKQIGVDPLSYCSEYYEVVEGGIWPCAKSDSQPPKQTYHCLISAMLGLRKHGVKVEITKA